MRLPGQGGARLGRALAVTLLLGGGGAAAAFAQAPGTTAFACPMHPDVTGTTGAACPRCGMALVESSLSPDAPEYRLGVETRPRAPRAGETTELRFTIRHPDTGVVVRDFAVVHEKIFHLFVISHDLLDYQHIHPQRQADGSFTIDVMLARPGYYKLYADFFPVGGTPQVIPRLLVTSDAAIDLAGSQARLVPDRVLRRSAGGLDVTLELPASGLVAGREETLRYHLRDAATGAPVGDVEPYLGAFGHALVMSEDTLHYVHAHPVEPLPAGVAQPRGGPEIAFKALLPKPGRYRIWTQIQRAGALATVGFTIEAASPVAAIR